MTNPWIRDPSAEKKIETPRHKNHLKTKLHEPSTLLGFPDQAKIFQHPRFSKYHSIPLEEVAYLMKGEWYSCQFNLPDITLYISIVYNKQKKAEKKNLNFKSSTLDKQFSLRLSNGHCLFFLVNALVTGCSICLDPCPRDKWVKRLLAQQEKLLVSNNRMVLTFEPSKFILNIKIKIQAISNNCHLCERKARKIK